MVAIILGSTALLFGLFFGACEVVGAYEFLLADQGSMTYIVWAGCGIAAAVSLLPAWGTYAFRGRPLLSFAIWILFFAALGTVISAAIARTGSATDSAQEGREKADTAHDTAQKAEGDAKADVDRAETALAKSRADVTENASKKTCASNCRDLLTNAVKAAQADLDVARRRLDSARSMVVAAPPKKTDALSKRIAALFPTYVTEDQVRLYQPIAIPALTSALSAVLMALGIWSMGRVFGKSSKPTPVTPKASAEPPEPLAAPASGAKAPPLALPPAHLQIVGPGSKLADFASKRLARDRGVETDMREARRAYEDYCAQQIEAPLGLSDFARELAALCRHTGIAVRIDGKDAYLVGARLVA